MDHSSNARLSGIWLPLITPFIDGAVDERSLARLVAHYLAQNIDGLIVAVVAIAVSFVATIYPSWSASRVLPAEALRYE